MATLQEQISNRAASAPQQKIQTIDPTRLMQSSMAAQHDYRMAQLNNQYESDRMRAKAHMEQLMNQESAKAQFGRDKELEQMRQANNLALEKVRSKNNRRNARRQLKATTDAQIEKEKRESTRRGFPTPALEGAYKLSRVNQLDQLATQLLTEYNKPWSVERDEITKKYLSQVTIDTSKVPAEQMNAQDQLRLRMEALKANPSLFNEYNQEIKNRAELFASRKNEISRQLGKITELGGIPQMVNPISPSQSESTSTTKEGGTTEDFLDSLGLGDDPENKKKDPEEKEEKTDFSLLENPIARTAQTAAIVGAGTAANRAIRGKQAGIAARDLFGNFDIDELNESRMNRDAAAQAKKGTMRTLSINRTPAEAQDFYGRSKIGAVKAVREADEAARADLSKKLSNLSPEDKVKFKRMFGQQSKDIIDFSEELFKQNKLLDSSTPEGRKLIDAINKSRTALKEADRAKASAYVFKELEEKFSAGLITKGSQAATKAATKAGLKKSILKGLAMRLGPRVASAFTGPAGWIIGGLSFAPDIWKMFKGDEKNED